VGREPTRGWEHEAEQERGVHFARPHEDGCPDLFDRGISADPARLNRMSISRFSAALWPIAC